MKLVRISVDGAPRVGVIVGDGIVDVAAVLLEFDTMAAVIAAGQTGLDQIATACGGATPAVPLAEVLAPVERPGKYLAIGMNCAEHLEEADRLGVARAKCGSTSRQRASVGLLPEDRKLSRSLGLGRFTKF